MTIFGVECRRDDKQRRLGYFKLRFLLFFGTTGCAVTHKENSGIALASKQGENRIDSGNHIAAHADRHGPGQDDSRATFTIGNPSDKEKEPDIDIKQGNNSPGIVHQFTSVFPEIAHNESIGQRSPHNNGKDD